ncbi:uncharacterized protein LOC128234536 [Mya arenaria]|uniref:uncharacterized protein LOC128234536 n=1 Tax=Mya arenaria TaxID=6604 RepID=UPI0022DF7E67|nr:uncharacterized protein LOC128234536 [Mya arenaria]
MGRDNLSIVSFNSSRRGLNSLRTSERSPYLERIIEGSSPDICLLPGDDKAMTMNAVRGYGQYYVPSADGTVLLYDSNRIRMNEQQVNVNGFGPLPELDTYKMVLPSVQVLSLMPSNDRSVVKEFSLVSWKYTMFSQSRDKTRTLESLIVFCQWLALSTEKAVFIGGEMAIDYDTIVKITKNLSQKGRERYVSDAQSEMVDHAFLPSMTKATVRDRRHLFEMNVYKCKSDPVLSSNEPQADCFISSKILELSEAKLVDVEKVCSRQCKLETLVDVEKVSSKQCELETLRKICPTATTMTIPQRPPRHHGG